MTVPFVLISNNRHCFSTATAECESLQHHWPSLQQQCWTAATNKCSDHNKLHNNDTTAATDNVTAVVTVESDHYFSNKCVLNAVRDTTDNVSTAATSSSPLTDHSITTADLTYVPVFVAGVSVTIPEGAIKKGSTEEVFVAVCRDDKDRPKLSGEFFGRAGDIWVTRMPQIPAHKTLHSFWFEK